MEDIIEYIEPQVLKEALANKESGFVIIDVRDSDWTGGNIKGSINVPSSSRIWDLDAGTSEAQKFVSGFLERRETVVFHCLKSQVRGPACAKIFVQVARTVAGGGAAPKVLVLKGGFETFYQRFKDENAALFENI